MADIEFPTRNQGIGGVALKAAGLVAATTAHDGVTVGRTRGTIDITWTACEIASNDELYIVAVEANTKAAASTWKLIGVVGAFGATEKLASMGDTPATGTFRMAVDNPYDNQIRLKTWVSGSIATGMNYSAKFAPIDSLALNG